MRLGAILVCATLIGACTEVTEAVDGTARKGAKSVVTEVLATRFPQVPKELITPFTDCIIDNSDAGEIQEYVKAAVRGVDEGTVDTIRTVLSRTETIRCVGGSAGLLG